MSGIFWPRRPSAGDTTVHTPPRQRTTSGGGLAAFTNVLGLNKAKSRERLRNTGTSSMPAKTSSNRQTVVSTESGSSDMWPNEPTTPSSASDTKRSFQGGIGVGDDPFARPPVYVSKDIDSPSLAAFPDPPARRPRTATPRNHSTPLLLPDQRHLHPASASPKSSSSKLGSSRASSPNRSRSTSASSSVPPSAKSPRTPPPMISCVSPADMHAHADAVSWSPESMYEQPRDDTRRAGEISRDDVQIRRGQSAHAVLSHSSRPTPRLTHSASSSHLSSPAVPPSPLLSPHARAGLSAAASGMGSMTAMASGIVTGLDEKKPPKRPSRSELRNQPSTSSLANQIIPPKRKASLLALQTPFPEAPPESITQVLEPNRLLEPTPHSPNSIIKVLESLELTPRSPQSPDSISPRPRTASTPSVASPRPRRNQLPSSPRIHPSSPRILPSSPRILPSSPRLLPSSPRSPPIRPSEDSLEDLDNYHFTIAPAIQEGDAQSISFSELGFQLGDDEDVWSDDGVTFHHGGTDSLHHISADTSRYGRRPPPSPTSLPFMAGNARRRPRQDTVYPSGVHTIPISDQRALAKMGEEDLRGEDAVVGQSHIELAASIEEEPDQFPTPPASSPSPINPLERISSGSQTSSCSSITPDAIPPQTISSHVAFSKHARNGSYSDSELDFEMSRKPMQQVQSTQTAVAWRCGAGNHEKCCGTRAMTEGPNTGQYKCCAERTPSGKNARCCASFIGRPCERPRVSSTSSAELKRQRSLHFSSLPGPSAPGGKRAKGFFHRPHTSHGKSTSSALLDDETRAIIQSKTREDPGPQSPTSDVFAAVVASPPMSPASRHEFRAKPIISPAKLNDHLKERVSVSPAPTPDPLKSPKLEPTRARSNTTTTDSGSVSVSSVFSDAPAPMRSLPARPRRIQNVSLPAMTTSLPVQQPRRYVQSITSVVQPSGLTRPPPRSPIGPGSGFVPIAPGSGLPPPPPRRHVSARVTGQPIVSFISSRSAPTPHTEPTVALKHRSSRESYESSRTVRRERSIPLRENQMSFLEMGVEEEPSDEEEQDEFEPHPQPQSTRPTLQHTQSFLDLSSRQSGDTFRENMAMFS